MNRVWLLFVCLFSLSTNSWAEEPSADTPNVIYIRTSVVGEAKKPDVGYLILPDNNSDFSFEIPGNWDARFWVPPTAQFTKIRATLYSPFYIFKGWKQVPDSGHICPWAGLTTMEATVPGNPLYNNFIPMYFTMPGRTHECLAEFEFDTATRANYSQVTLDPGVFGVGDKAATLTANRNGLKPECLECGEKLLLIESTYAYAGGSFTEEYRDGVTHVTKGIKDYFSYKFGLGITEYRKVYKKNRCMDYFLKNSGTLTITASTIPEELELVGWEINGSEPSYPGYAEDVAALRVRVEVSLGDVEVRAKLKPIPGAVEGADGMAAPDEVEDPSDTHGLPDTEMIPAIW